MAGDIHYFGPCWCGQNHAQQAWQQGYEAAGASVVAPDEALRDALEGAASAMVEAIDHCRRTKHLRHPADCYCSVNASLDDLRAALAAPPVAPAGTVERCACGHERRWHDGSDGEPLLCDCEGDGVAGLCACPGFAPLPTADEATTKEENHG